VAFATDNPRPTLTMGLIAINLAIFMAGLIVRGLSDALFYNGALFPNLVLGDFQLHRLITAMFLHSSIAHIVLNMVSLYSLGREVELVYGTWRYLGIYFLGGIAGSAFSAAIGDYGIPSVGASGAVLAVWAAQLCFLYQNRVLFGQERIRQVLTQNLIYLGFFILIGFLPGARIDNWGHIGGFLGGLAVAWLLPVRLKIQQITLPDGQPARLLVDTNRWNQQRHLPLLALAAIGVLLLLVLGMLGFRLNLFPTTNVFGMF
jgi:rhomboid protease GluP